MKTCSIDGCGKKSEKRGWCGMHYRRWRIHGDTTKTLKAPNGAGYEQGGYLGRMAAMEACGDPNKRPCRHCKKYDALVNLRVYERPEARTTAYWHLQCARDAAKARYHKEK